MILIHRFQEKKKMKRAMVLSLALALSGLCVAQAQQSTGTTTKSTKKKAAAAKPDAVATQLGELKQAIDAQQAQIKQLSDQVQSRDQQIQQLQQRLDQSQTATTEAQSKAEAAQSQASAQSQTVDSLKSDVADLKMNSTNAAVALQEAQTNITKQFESPGAIHYKGITITPGGYVEAATVTRQRATSADINTPFNSIPFPGNSLSRVWENNFTARQSRLSLLGESKIGNVKLTGYWEADFLGTGVTSNNRQSNSYVLRQRVIYGQAKFDNGFSFTAGQMWSLVTEDKKGIDNRQELPPLVIDPQYNVGFSWARQYGARVVKDFNGKFAIGIAAEAPQATIGGRGFSSLAVNNAGTVNTTTNTFLDAPGAGGGLFNFVDTTGYTINKAPDGIVKVAADPGWGHYEVYGVVSTFRNRVFPCGVAGSNQGDTTATGIPPAFKGIVCPVTNTAVSSAAGAFNDTRVGGGIGANFRLPVVPKVLDFEVQGLAGDGVGRYGSAQLADLTFRPNGTEALIRTAHGMTGLEYHSNKLDAYVYGGAEYAARTSYTGYDSISVIKTAAIPASTTFPSGSPATTLTTIKTNGIGGYGSPFANNTGCLTELPPNNTTGATTVGGLNPVTTPSGGGTCAGDTRIIEEGTLGFWYKFFQGPKGGLRWGIQYSYFMKDGWSGNNNKPVIGFAPKSVDNMVWTSFRYYIP
jgi:hypothetical protein